MTCVSILLLAASQSVVFALLLKQSISQESYSISLSGYPLYNSLWDRCSTSPAASGNTSDFGCGDGLSCVYQDQWTSQCKPNATLTYSLWTSCPVAQINVTGKGTSSAACAIGSYCDGNENYAQCKPCRTSYVTCGASASDPSAASCCPGMIVIEHLIIDVEHDGHQILTSVSM